MKNKMKHQINLPGFIFDNDMNSMHFNSNEQNFKIQKNNIVPQSMMQGAGFGNFNSSFGKLFGWGPGPIHCKTECGWEVCGSALPGTPVPMCWDCKEKCWMGGGSY